MTKQPVKPLESFEKKAQEIENRKEQLRLEREHKKQAKITRHQRAIQEKLLAPILLLITILCSVLIILYFS